MADFPVQDRKVESGLAGLQGQAGAHHWQVSVRGDQNSEYGHHTTGAAAYGYDVSPTVRLHASVSNSFVAPTFDQLYYPGFSNPHLLPEQGHNREAGVRYLAGGQEVQLTYFDNRVRDFIVAGASPVNVPRTTMEGTTLSYARRWTLWRVRASWDHLHARNDATGARLARVADDSANVDVEREMGAWSAGVHVRTVGPRVDYLPSLTMGGYTVVDAHLRWQVKSAISVFARIDNLTDRRYETSYGYNEPRRGLFVGMSWSD
jgi:vitamin B12 transporter